VRRLGDQTRSRFGERSADSQAKGSRAAVRQHLFDEQRVLGAVLHEQDIHRAAVGFGGLTAGQARESHRRPPWTPRFPPGWFASRAPQWMFSPPAPAAKRISG